MVKRGHPVVLLHPLGRGLVMLASLAFVSVEVLAQVPGQAQAPTPGVAAPEGRATQPHVGSVPRPLETEADRARPAPDRPRGPPNRSAPRGGCRYNDQKLDLLV